MSPGIDSDANGDHTGLITRYLAGDCSPAETEFLGSLIERDVAACGLLVEIALQAVVVRDEEQLPTAPGLSPHQATGRLSGAVWGGIVVALLVATFAVGWRSATFERDSGIIGRVESATAVARFRASGRTALLALGDTFGPGVLSTGTLETAALRLRDGTLLSLGTDTTVELRDDGQKRLELRSGALTADVVPQPAGRPMVVRTPSLELEVIGTSFSLASELLRTRLDVNEGLVRVRRLADNATIDVPAGGELRVSDEATEPLFLGGSETPPDSWSVNFSDGVPEGWQAGHWLPDQGVVRAVPTINGRSRHAVISNNAWAQGNDCLVLLQEDSRLRVTVMRLGRGPLDVVLSLREAHGNFVGNVLLRDPEMWNGLPPGEWRTLELPLRDFVPVAGIPAVRVPGKAVFKVTLTTRQVDVHLHVRDISIARRS